MFNRTVLILFTVAIVGLMGCSERVPQEIGLFYKADGKFLKLTKGGARDFNDRSITIDGNNQPQFIFYIPGKDVSNLRFATQLKWENDGDARYRPISAAISPIKGKESMFLVSPENKLPNGPGALIMGNPLGRNTIYTDVENCWPYIIK